MVTYDQGTTFLSPTAWRQLSKLRSVRRSGITSRGSRASALLVITTYQYQLSLMRSWSAKGTDANCDQGLPVTTIEEEIYHISHQFSPMSHEAFVLSWLFSTIRDLRHNGKSRRRVNNCRFLTKRTIDNSNASD